MLFRSIVIGPGSNMIIYTDGLTESSFNGPVLSASQATILIAGLVAENADATALVNAFLQLQPGDNFNDDVSLMLARF